MNEKTTETRAGGTEPCCPFCYAFRMAHELKDSLKSRVPQGFWEHRAAARREGLLALRSLIDAAIAANEPAPARKATRIKVE